MVNLLASSSMKMTRLRFIPDLNDSFNIRDYKSRKTGGETFMTKREDLGERP